MVAGITDWGNPRVGGLPVVIVVVVVVVVVAVVVAFVVVKSCKKVQTKSIPPNHYAKDVNFKAIYSTSDIPLQPLRGVERT
jgi:flagellar basal body-associated protein FliL